MDVSEQQSKREEITRLRAEGSDESQQRAAEIERELEDAAEAQTQEPEPSETSPVGTTHTVGKTGSSEPS